MRGLERPSSWLLSARRVAIAAAEVNDLSIDTFLACPSRRRYKHRTALHQFIEHLRTVGL